MCSSLRRVSKKQLAAIAVVAICVVALIVSYMWRTRSTAPHETSIVRIRLSGGPERPDAEISGLAWYGDDSLVLLPQYPGRFSNSVFTVDADAIEAAITSDAQGPIAARLVPFEVVGLEEAIPGFDGFEAIAIVGDEVYVSIEARPDPEHTVGYLVRGVVEGDLDRIVLDVSHRARLANQTDLLNTAYEAIIVHDDEVIALYEANGAINRRPRAMRFDRALDRRPPLTFAPLEYRVTDATSVDRDGRFWVANYHWPGSPWTVGECSITERHGRGESHARCRTVERLVELQIQGRRIVTSDRAPIQLELIDDDHARNWEGVVRFRDRGFLVATDEHPESILAFVPADP
jgi:hypothetical protein